MAQAANDIQTFSVDAHVIEVVEEGGRRFVKLAFDEPIVVDVTRRARLELDLGDRVAVHGWLGVGKEVV